MIIDIIDRFLSRLIELLACKTSTIFLKANSLIHQILLLWVKTDIHHLITV